ncbi:hypothetical protein AVEN_71339-1 [Araneus ventricosus]|uniref:Uncharacterized protein n=1 Tax=Araneus ventricosus TaxID=182803 RepID=A0A4Y2BJB5_ARAVE|nr:hypothetical protein AVEN_71339-1 [Araneus ventricosus]
MWCGNLGRGYQIRCRPHHLTAVPKIILVLFLTKLIFLMRAVEAGDQRVTCSGFRRRSAIYAGLMHGKYARVKCPPSDMGVRKEGCWLMCHLHLLTAVQS